MSDEKITLESVESFMRERRKSLAFPPELEALFVRDTWVRRGKLLRITTLKLAFVYNIFILGDWYLANDVLLLAVALHLLLVTPWILLVAWYVVHASSAPAREIAAASAPVAIVLQILAIYYVTRSPYDGYYLYFVLVTTIGANSIHRLNYRYASAGSHIIFALLLLAVTCKGTLPWRVEMMQLLTYSIAAFVTLNSNMIIERDQRRFYLHALHDRLAAARAAEIANIDALTGVGNRRFLFSRAEALWRETVPDVSVAVILFDLDFFKRYNDAFGHSAGDVCLARVAACARAALRGEGDLAVRYGGEEFLILLPRADLHEAVAVAEDVRRAIEALRIETDHALGPGVMTGSFGVASGPAATLSLDALIAQADTALYAAKRNGRNQVWPPLQRSVKSDAAGRAADPEGESGAGETGPAPGWLAARA